MSTTPPRTVEEWAIRRQRALDALDLYISVLSGYARLHGMSDEAIAEALSRPAPDAREVPE